MDRNILERYNIINNLIEKVADQELITLSKFLKQRIKNPDLFVMMLGETSSGKTTLINGLLGSSHLYTSPIPATGAIVEVVMAKGINNLEYYAVNNDATMEKLDKNTFDNLLKKPDDKLERVRLVANQSKYRLEGMRLFDTPGFDSVVSDHEVVLKEFIPNGDIIIYTVNYRIGVQQNDFYFMKQIVELVRENVKFILVINFCPVGIKLDDKRIREIRNNVKDIVQTDLENVIIEQEEVGEDEYPLPSGEDLWKSVQEIGESPEREKEMKDVLYEYVDGLFFETENKVNLKYLSIKSSLEDIEAIEGMAKQLFIRSEEIISELIIPRFDSLLRRVGDNIDEAVPVIKSRVGYEIDDIGTVNMEDGIPFINYHILPKVIGEEVDEIQRVIEIELSSLNEEVNDLLNQEFIEFQKDVSIQLSSKLGDAGEDIFKEIGRNTLSTNLVKYFGQYGGGGGAGAGVANSASRLLKKVGDTFGKTFSRETHNALKHTLSKIGATSIKAVQSAAAVILEVVSIVYDLATWKEKLKNKSSEGIDKWHDETKEMILKDLKDLEVENINLVRDIVDEQISLYRIEIDESDDHSDVLELIEEMKDVKEGLEL